MFNRTCQLVRDEGENILIFLAITHMVGVALDYQHTECGAPSFKRDSQPIQRRSANQLNLILLYQDIENFLSTQQGLTRAQHILGQSAAQPLWGWTGILFIHKIRKTD